METDVNSPTSTCTSEVSFSVGSSSEESSEEDDELIPHHITTLVSISH